MDKQIEINADFTRALNLLEKTTKPLFITGKAGTGKSTLLQYFRDSTSKNLVILAPTGVAALNVKGQTIHSFFKFPPHITVQAVTNKAPNKKIQALLQKIDTIIIDEASMVRADLLDCIDEALRYYLQTPEPFGGIQMVFIGDLYQLPPVVSGQEERELFKTHYKSPYFFDAHALQDLEMEFIELEKIYRQKDQDFIELLNKIRNSSVDENDIAKLNTRLDPHFDHDDTTDEFFITLTTTNAAADELNAQKLSRLKTKSQTFHGEITDKFDQKHLPTSMELEVKVGAQVMLLNNDPGRRWVNGSIGKIVKIEWDDDSEQDQIVVQLNDGDEVHVAPFKWEVFRYFFNQEAGHLDSEIIGSFTQYPLRLAWAVTIHKSQGKTFDNVVVDLGRGSFVQGQVYVAISRCTNFEGLILKTAINKRNIWIDYHIMRFLTNYQYQISERAMPLEDKIQRIQFAIEENSTLDITYLKANDTRSQRTIQPRYIGDIQYLGKTFLGIKAYCQESKQIRHFRVDHILAID